jgi:hypothetical protein
VEKVVGMERRHLSWQRGIWTIDTFLGSKGVLPRVSKTLIVNIDITRPKENVSYLHSTNQACNVGYS